MTLIWWRYWGKMPTMLPYLARRLAALMPTLFGVTVAVFLILKLVPGDPALALLGPRATEQSVAELRSMLADRFGRPANLF